MRVSLECKVHGRVGKRLSSCKFISAQTLIGSTIMEFSITRSNQSQHVVLEGCWAKPVNVTSATGKCFGPVVVPPGHLGAVLILENKLIGYADDFALMAVVLSLGVRVTVAAESLKRALCKVSEW